MYGNSRPFFALVGVSLASGNGMLTNENQLEGVCWEIRVRTLFIIMCVNYSKCIIFNFLIGSSWPYAKEPYSC